MAGGGHHAHVDFLGVPTKTLSGGLGGERSAWNLGLGGKGERQGGG